MSITPSSAPTLRRIYVDFLGGLPRSPSDPTPECMKRALVKLAELAADPSIASRSLKSPMSFSLVSSCGRQSKDLNALMHGTSNGFSPFPSDYRAERKFLERTKGLFHRRSDSRLHVREDFPHEQQQPYDVETISLPGAGGDVPGMHAGGVDMHHTTSTMHHGFAFKASLARASLALSLRRPGHTHKMSL
ncbi:hypothetical protein EI94DRAFT_664759 [Lactarius quietus]|nr:hypothetical protein EI94DRAFT_664759 [Lactarius quietus]